jgi:hypothetical protein
VTPDGAKPQMGCSMPDEPSRAICGIVMPISAIDSCSEQHWAGVREILSDSIEDADFIPQLVSDADEVGIIHKRIVQNLYENPIVVVDVSAKNPNVMFELGMRFAFDRPTVIVKDDKTSYSFDTSTVEHLTYPRDLRFGQIVEFKEALTDKIRATVRQAENDPNYTTFLKHFGTFKVAKTKTETVSPDQIVLEELRSLRELVGKLVSSPRPASALSPTLCLQIPPAEVVDALDNALRADGYDFKRLAPSNGYTHIRFTVLSAEDRKKILNVAQQHVPAAKWLNTPSPRVQA